MKLKVRRNQMEEVEGLRNAYPYVYHHVSLRYTPVPWHWHEALEFNYIVSGSMQVSTPSQTLVFSGGEGFFINSNILMTMTDLDQCVMDSHLFHPVLLGGHFQSVFETKYLQPVLQDRHIEIVPVRNQSPGEEQLLRKLRQLSALQAQENTEFQTRNLLCEIWLLLLAVLQNTKPQAPAMSYKNQDRILTMMTYIRDNLNEKLSLEDIAASASISSRECLRCFRECVHQSPTEYLIACRIEAAKKLLQTTTLTVTDIALRCGFNSSAYFSKVFRQQFGMTPSQYRSRHADSET